MQKKMNLRRLIKPSYTTSGGKGVNDSYRKIIPLQPTEYRHHQKDLHENTTPYRYKGKLNMSSTKPIKSIFQPNFTIKHSNICKRHKSLKILVLVFSKAMNQYSRKTIRETWASYKEEVLSLFVLGKSLKTSEQSLIESENREHRDIIQGNFYDSWENLKLKALFMLYWAHTYCNNTKFVLKIDDDVFGNLKAIKDYLNRFVSPKNIIFGLIIQGLVVDRTPPPFSKYYLSYEEYSSDTYMNFISGPAFVMTFDIIKKIYEVGMNYPWTRVVDDVFITGFIAQENSYRK